MTLEQALVKLKGAGVRMTPQRQAILDYLVHSMTHPTADEIYKALSPTFPNMSVATIYNNLRLFARAHLVRELKYGNDSSRFDADLTDHYHAICNVCGKIVDFHYPVLHNAEVVAEQETGFVVEGHRMEIYGTCMDCQRAAAATN
jgi:Fur family peroxide stress response transcriptional regulator